MNQVRNYQKELDKLIDTINGVKVPRLLLHSCCAPCSSYCLEYLRHYFRITVFYYNPNISLDTEYKRRVEEQKRLISAYNIIDEPGLYPIDIIEGDYEPKVFYDAVKGFEKCKEGGERCFICYELRLKKALEIAENGSFDYYGTTLTISPLKNAAKLNEIGESLASSSKVLWLPSDFKKKNGYKRSVELSKEYDLYRQDFCGCAFSKAERYSSTSSLDL